jgi:hypothetical protein
MVKKVTLKFRAKRYGRITFKDVDVAYDDWKPVVMNWLWPALEQFAKDTDLDRIHLTTWDLLSFGLPGLAQVPSWSAFAKISIKDLELEDVRDLYIDIDDTFHRLWGKNQGALRSATTRKFLTDHLLELRPDGALVRANMAFRPKGRADHTPRPLISDGVRYEDGQAKDAPLGALPHANPKELKALQLKRMQADLDAITDACCRELDTYYRACAVQDAILAEAWEPTFLKSVLDNLPNKDLIDHVRALSNDERRALVAHYLQVDSRLETPFEAARNKGGVVLAPELAERMGIEPLDLQRCLRYRYYPHQTVLIAAIVLIQLATAWNVGAVIELKKKDVRSLPTGGYLIQSIKDKTGDDTPMVLIEGHDHPAARALRFALQRLESLVRRGWAGVDEQCLWLSSESNFEASRGQPISNLQKPLKTIRERYALPYFSFEMVRTQKLTVVSVEEGPIAAAELAGHSTFSTIGDYIDHLITRRLNSSINLEFQRRWEEEVAARIAMEPVGIPLVPIGDGSSCLDSSKPADEAWLSGGVCDGAHCHEDGGCPNRKLVIDRDRVEEAVLTRRYYDANWNRLYSENPKAFAEIHVPRLEFNLYLVEYLKKGPYRHLING